MPLKVDINELASCAELFPSGGALALERLAAALFVGSPNPGGRLMAMFAAYFDAAGSAHDQPFVVVSGYVANYYQWKSFETMWAHVHKQFGVELPFHATEFIAATTNPSRYAKQANARADYVRIGGEPERAETFLRLLCIAQLTMVNCAFSCIVNMHIYNNVSSLLDLREVVPPYALGARSCLAMVHEWESKFDIQESVECIFEEGDFEQGKFTELVVSEGGPVPIYKPKHMFAGLQAADHFGWEQFHFLKRELKAAHLPSRETFKILLNAIPKIHIEVSTQGLINLCHAKRIDPRTGVRHEKQ
jgi:uncharacterized protein DUF3800